MFDGLNGIFIVVS